MQHSKLLPALCLCALTLACKRPDPIRLQPTVEEPVSLPSVINFSDPVADRQLVRGFYELEKNAWRWAAPQSDVALGVPPGARKTGAVLFLEFSLLPESIAALKSVTVTGKLEGAALPPETYTTPGTHEYRRDVRPEALTRDVVDAEFLVDKFLKPPGDGRDLAMVVKTIGLESK